MISVRVSAAEISQFCEYMEPCLTTEAIEEYISNNIDTSIYDGYYISAGKFGSSNAVSFVFFSTSLMEQGHQYVNEYTNGDLDFYGETSYMGFTIVHSENFPFKDDWSKKEVSKMASSIVLGEVYIANSDIKDKNGNVIFPKNSDNIFDGKEEFLITVIDSEFDYNYATNYVKGEQANTVEFYIQDSGILFDSHAKGYEIDKIYLDENLKNEIFLDDILEKDTILYITFKSKINITSEIKKDSFSNDVIHITYDFSKIYEENYSYWVTNDGENYVDITEYLNDDKKYVSDVYFFGRYYACVRDDTNNTISVSYIHIKYYKISINSQIGSEIDDDGNLSPYIILDYSAYKGIKDNLIFEYSINNGVSWVDVTNKLDSNLKYKLYIKINDIVVTRVRSNGSTMLSFSSSGSKYVVNESFYDYILSKDNFRYVFNKFIKPIRFIITSITNFYNNYCPPVVQDFFYFSFIVSIILILIKLFW